MFAVVALELVIVVLRHSFVVFFALSAYFRLLVNLITSLVWFGSALLRWLSLLQR